MIGQTTTGFNKNFKHILSAKYFYRRVIKELKATEAIKTKSGSISSFSNISTASSTESGKQEHILKIGSSPWQYKEEGK